MANWSPSLLCLLMIAQAAACLADSPVGATAANTGAPQGSAGGGNGGRGGSEMVLEFYMHEKLGGPNPTARPITDLLCDGHQVPFAKPIGSQTSMNGVQLGTGLSGTAYIQTPNGPVSTGQVQTHVGPDGLGPGLGFGTITIIDGMLTSGPDPGSQPIGKAQGIYVAVSSDGSMQMMAFTAEMEGGGAGDSMNLFGIYKMGTAVSWLTVTGGAGKFTGAAGYAEVRRQLFPSGQQHTTEGAGTLLRITAHIAY